MKRELPAWGKACKVQMILMGKRLEDVSNDTGLSRTYISSIINGRVVAPDSTVESICRSLGVDAPLECQESH